MCKFDVQDETGVYKNLLQEIAQRVGSPLPQYTTFRSGLGHLPVFKGTVELAGIIFTGEPAKSKKQAEKNAALAAWLSLKQCGLSHFLSLKHLLFCVYSDAFVCSVAQQEAASPSDHENNEEQEQEQIRIARALQSYHLKEKLVMPNNASIPFQNKFLVPTPRPSTAPTSKILPFFFHKPASTTRPPSPVITTTLSHIQRFPAVGAAPYVPIRHCRTPYHGIAPPVTIRTAVPVFSAPPPPAQLRLAPPVCIRQAVPASAAAAPPSATNVHESTAVRCLEKLEIWSCPAKYIYTDMNYDHLLHGSSWCIFFFFFYIFCISLFKCWGTMRKSVFCRIYIIQFMINSNHICFSLYIFVFLECCLWCFVRLSNLCYVHVKYDIIAVHVNMKYIDKIMK